MFEPELVRRAGITHGLLLVDTDHGFNLGYDPSVANALRGVLVARRHGDANDGLLYRFEGQPTTHRYVYDVHGAKPPHLVRYVPPWSQRSEAESEWPVNPQHGPSYPVHYPCASAGRALRLFRGSVVKFQPAHPFDDFELGWVSTHPGTSQIVVRQSSYAGPWASSFGDYTVPPPIQLSATGPGCVRWRLPGQVTHLDWYSPDREPFEISVELTGGEGAVDYVDYLGGWGEP